MPRPPSEPFSLTHGGPFHKLSCAARLVDPRRQPRWFWYAAIAWLPLVASALVRWAITGKVDPVLRDPTVHARFLICMPLVIAAARLLENRVEHVMGVVRREELTDDAALDALQARAIRLRDSRVIETALAVIALIGSQLVVWQVGDYILSFEAIWYATIALPLFQFLMLRWIWHWLLWSYLLAHLSRLPLATNALHPDGAAGLGTLDVPTSAFAVFIAGLMTLASAQWTTNILEHGSTLERYIPTFFAFTVIAVAIACAPLLPFFGHLVHARNRDLHAQHTLALEFVDAFRRKWILDHRASPLRDAPKVRAAMMIAPEFQALNDVGAAFLTTERTRLLPIGKRAFFLLWLAAVIPMIPVILTSTPLSQVATHLGTLILGGVPLGNSS